MNTEPVYLNVNEDGFTYDKHDNMDAAMNILKQFPNDSVVVKLEPKPEKPKNTLRFLDRLNRRDLLTMKDIIDRARVTPDFWNNGYITLNEANELEAKINGIMFDCAHCGKEGGH